MQGNLLCAIENKIETYDVEHPRYPRRLGTASFEEFRVAEGVLPSSRCGLLLQSCLEWLDYSPADEDLQQTAGPPLMNM